MRLVLLAGGIASGKSTVGRLLGESGALRVDLDALSREVTAPASPVLGRLAEAFGPDVLDGAGRLRRDVLAARAFASAEQTALLESIVHPAIQRRLDELRAQLAGQNPAGVLVVEVPLLDRAEYLMGEADDVLCVVCPLALRRERAVLRGMDPADFDARVARQPSDEYLVARATAVLRNDEDEQSLRARVSEWWHGRACTEKS